MIPPDIVMSFIARDKSFIWSITTAIIFMGTRQNLTNDLLMKFPIKSKIDLSFKSNAQVPWSTAFYKNKSR